ncbi:carbohydrate-binding protein [Geofilum sp. OHC36d9]|uniref:carbohydrate-binding protein n=1 Tax=Geofilum sp. OHC36d9 TaxID=3458413 RepID=UPI0040348529
MFTQKKIILLFICILLVNTASHAQWSLVWSDEFEGSISADWSFETGMGSNGWGNNELQYYTTNNSWVENGQLVIQARNENYEGASYTSARLKTQGNISWKYGKIEARIAMPSFMGVWPAFWMLGDNISSEGWPKCGEIDIMEHVNNENTTYGTAHWYDAAYASYSGSTEVNDITAYHVYSVEWNEQYIKWYLDGTQFHVMDITGGVNGTSEFHANFFLLLNMAIGGNWPGFSVDNSAFPANMYIDYVRVYKQNSSAFWSVMTETENYSSMSGVETETCSEGGLNVAYIDAGDWMAYNSITIPSSGNYTIEYRVASLEGGGSLSLDLNAGSIVLGSVDIPSTGDWQNWTTVSHSVYIDAGIYDFGIYAPAGGWNINNFTITQGLKSTRINLSTEAEEVTELSVYPSPVSDILYIQGVDCPEKYEVKIYNTIGDLVLRQQLIKSNAISVSVLEPGIYIIQIANCVSTKTFKFVKL